MKILKKLLFISAAMFCFSMAASAQQATPTPTPLKKPPVVIIVPDKNRPKEEKPKNDNGKPNMSILDLPRKVFIESV